MGKIVVPGNPPLDVALKRVARARRITLRVSRINGRLTVSAPPHVPEREIRAFVGARRDWMISALGAVPDALDVGPGMSIPLEGQHVRIEAAPGARASLGDGVLTVASEAPGPRVAGFLKSRARVRLAPAVNSFAKVLGRRYARLTLRDTVSRWGSCSATGNLMFSWRLVMAPPDVLRYVAAHEVAHLVHMDHSSAFWGVVAELDPDYARHRQWLRTEGTALFRFRFGD
ncbi:MAG: SprT family zinc-dependent metalloprotease [Pseudomonadota bacterium]